MGIDEVISAERRNAYRLRDKAWRARSEKVSQERTEEAEYHETVISLLKELKEYRMKSVELSLGQKVYVNDHGTLYPAIVTQIFDRMGKTGFKVDMFRSYRASNIDFTVDDIGRTVFLNKEDGA